MNIVDLRTVLAVVDAADLRRRLAPRPGDHEPVGLALAGGRCGHARAGEQKLVEVDAELADVLAEDLDGQSAVARLAERLREIRVHEVRVVGRRHLAALFADWRIKTGNKLFYKFITPRFAKSDLA
jgi:hypothetical protein